MTAPRPRVALLLDEMFSPSIAAELRRRGHDVIAVAADPQLRSMTDPELYAWAISEHRRIVTENVKDFRRLLTQDSELTGPGLLFTSVRTFPRSRRAPGSLIASLESWLTQSAPLVRPAEDWLLLASEREGTRAVTPRRSRVGRERPPLTTGAVRRETTEVRAPALWPRICKRGARAGSA